MSIGYRGLGSLNQVEEIASCSLDTFEEMENGIFKRAQEVSSTGKVETKESQTEENVDTTTPKRKIQYYNKNTFNDNLQIKRIEDNEMWKINGKDAKQIENVFENIATKMEELNKGQMQNNVSSYENKSKADIITLGLIPYFSIVGINNIEYDKITYKDVASFYTGTAIGITSVGIYVYNSALDSIKNTNLQLEMNRLDI